MSAGRCRAFLNQVSGSEKDFESELRLNKVSSSYLKSASWLGLSYTMPQPHSRSLEAITPPGDVSPRPSRSPPPRTTPRQQDISWSDLTNSSPSSKKTLNVESPSFTPSTLQQPTKKSTFSSQAASAAVFTPRGAGGEFILMEELYQSPSLTRLLSRHPKYTGRTGTASLQSCHDQGVYSL